MLTVTARTCTNTAFHFTVAQNLQNIIQEQIQTLSSGTTLLPTVAASSGVSAPPTASTVTSVASSMASNGINVNRPGSTANTVTTSSMLYRVPPPATSMSTSMAPSTAPVMQAQAALPTGVAGTVAPPAQQAPASISSNAQAALMILLTAQMQSQSGEPSVLQNPQVVSILQSLVNNADKSSDMNELVKDPSLAAVFSPVGPAGGTGPAGSTISLDANRPALLDTPKTRPILLGNAPPPPAMPVSTHNDLTAASAASAAAAGGLNGSLNDSMGELLNAQNLNQLLGSLSTPNTPTHPATSMSSSVSSIVAQQSVPVVSVASVQPQVQPQSLLPTPSSTGFMQVINFVTNDMYIMYHLLEYVNHAALLAHNNVSTTT